jgi:hypothetical protein
MLATDWTIGVHPAESLLQHLSRFDFSNLFDHLISVSNVAHRRDKPFDKQLQFLISLPRYLAAKVSVGLSPLFRRLLV